MTAGDDVKAKLKALRDKLALEAPRARTRANAPAHLVARLQSALECVNGMYLLETSARTAALGSQAVIDARDDALLEGETALQDWNTWNEQSRQAKGSRPVLRTPPTIDRRQYERHDTQVTVKLLRYRVSDALGDVTLGSETTSRPARNVSLGGIFVAVGKDDLANVGIGGVLHVSVSFGEGLSFQARATVVRREATGLGLRWVLDSDRVRKSVEDLLDAIRRSR